MAEKEMNILLACDSSYVMPLSVCLTSIFENNKGPIHIYIFEIGIKHRTIGEIYV
jgi:lipopolysaccharide biosynthesis glycosyltransferase